MNRPAKRVANAVVWESGMEVDADGAPDAYGPPGTPARDLLANAGSPGNWYGLACDEHGEPYVQMAQDPFPGMYVSTTALVDHSKSPDDPRRYVDSTAVAYASVPSDSLKLFGLHVGDVGYAYNRADAALAVFVVADVGPRGKWGEGSIKLAQDLGVPSSPKRGGCDSGIVWVVFPGSGRGWPRDWKDVCEQAADLLSAGGDLQAFL